MPTEIRLLKVGMTMTEGIIAEWHVADGAEVTKGDPLYTLETEKVAMEVEAPASGTVKHLVAAGTTLDPAAVVGYLYLPGEVIPATLPVPSAPESRVDASPNGAVEIPGIEEAGPSSRDAEERAQTPPDKAAGRPASSDAPPMASPLARRLAEQAGLDLREIRGSGPGGRITKEDVEAAMSATVAPALPQCPPAPGGPAPDGRRIAMNGMRRVIAQRTLESLQASAQLTMNMEVAIDEAARLRDALIEEWAAEGVRPSYTDLVITAVAKALRSHPRMNARLDGDGIVLLDAVDVGMAVAVEDGLLVPIIRGADRMTLKELSVESSRLARRARDGQLGPEEMSGGTFTVTSLGMHAVDSFTPILNAPEVGILGVNRIREGVGWEADRPVRRRTMNLSLTWDHRALDGVPAARFLVAVRDLLEGPHRLLDRRWSRRDAST